MSDPAVQSCHDRDETRGKSKQLFQSIWMDHWTRRSFRSINEAHSQLSLRCESGEDNCDVKHPLVGEPAVMETSSSKFVEGFRDVNKGKMTNFMNESRATSLKRLKNEALDGETFPMFKLSSRGGENSSVPESGESSGKHERVVRPRIGPVTGYDVSFRRSETGSPSMLAGAPSKTGLQTRASQFQPEDITWHPEQQVKSNRLLKWNGLAVSKPFPVDHVGSISEIVPYELHSERTTMQTLFSRQDDINQPGSTFLVHGKKTDNNAGPFISEPPTTNIQLSNFVGKEFRRMKNHSEVEPSPSQITPLERSQLEKLYRGSYTIHRMPSSALDAETMRIYATIDSMEEFSRGPPKFSQATHHFFITKNIDGGQMFRESAISTKFKGKTVSELFSLSSDFGLHVQQGVKLQPLESSADSEEKDNIGRVKTHAANPKNEASAETDTMDLDNFSENRRSGVASSPLNINKDISGRQKSPASQAAIPSVREEIRGGLLNTELSYLNQELPVLPRAEASADDKEASTSRTQSLDVEQLLSHAERSTDSKSSPCADAPSELEPFSRWVKRLEPNVSDSSVHGMKGSKMEEASSHEKFNKFVSKIFKTGKSVSGLKTNKSWDKEQVIYNTAELLRNVEASSSASVRKNEDVTLSHAWIQRWRHKPLESSKRKPEAVVCEPQTSKATFQKKQFPSVAAMALTGKAMNGFQPCQFRKRGSFVVWNTKRYNDELS